MRIAASARVTGMAEQIRVTCPVNQHSLREANGQKLQTLYFIPKKDTKSDEIELIILHDDKRVTKSARSQN